MREVKQAMANFSMKQGSSLVIAAAIHDGHTIRDELHPYLNLTEHERMKEEDPYTAYLTDFSDTNIVVHTSRFETDLNRPREKAVYTNPEDAWGMKVWKWDLPQEQIRKSCELYDEFYKQATTFILKVYEKHGYFILLDLHAYNYRRTNAYREDLPELSPEINLGTASVDPFWRPVIDNFAYNLTRCSINGRFPDVRENIRFRGGAFSQWVNRNFSEMGCAISVSLKKTFMDEWTGRADIHHLNEIKNTLHLASTKVMELQQETLVASK